MTKPADDQDSEYVKARDKEALSLCSPMLRSMVSRGEMLLVAFKIADWARAFTLAEMDAELCPFCKNTGKHLCPDVAQPILISCSKKDCVYGKLEAAEKEIEKLKAQCTEFIELGAKHSRAASFAEAKLIAALEREKKLVSALEQLKHVEFYPETIMSINGVEVKSYDLSAPYRPAIIALAENKKARGEICGD